MKYTSLTYEQYALREFKSDAEIPEDRRGEGRYLARTYKMNFFQLQADSNEVIKVKDSEGRDVSVSLPNYLLLDITHRESGIFTITYSYTRSNREEMHRFKAYLEANGLSGSVETMMVDVAPGKYVELPQHDFTMQFDNEESFSNALKSLANLNLAPQGLTVQTIDAQYRKEVATYAEHYRAVDALSRAWSQPEQTLSAPDVKAAANPAVSPAALSAQAAGAQAAGSSSALQDAWNETQAASAFQGVWDDVQAKDETVHADVAEQVADFGAAAAAGAGAAETVKRFAQQSTQAQLLAQSSGNPVITRNASDAAANAQALSQQAAGMLMGVLRSKL